MVNEAPRMHAGAALLLALGVGLAAACGGTVVVSADDDGDGSGGATPTGSTGASAVCFTADPSSDLFECGFGTTGSGAGMPCERRICDTAGNEWRSSCEGGGCVCFFNGSVKCSCSLQGGGMFCDGVTPSCCPEPFPDF